MHEKKKTAIKSLRELPRDIVGTAETTGIEETERQRSGSFFQLDESSVFSRVISRFKGQIEIMDTKDAIEKYD